MKKKTVIHYVGEGSVKLAAQRLGVTPSSLRRWATDADGNLVSERLRDRILARICRLKYERHVQRGNPLNAVEVDLCTEQHGRPVRGRNAAIEGAARMPIEATE